MLIRKSTLALILFLVSINGIAALDGYYRYPTISGDTVVFSAEGDLFAISLAGEPPYTAVRLTTHPGDEGPAAISPDGSMVAFSASYEGPAEVYTMPPTGGLPLRRTWHGGDSLVVGWKADGDLVYATQQFATLPGWHLVTLDLASGTEARVPLFDAADGSWNDTGDTLYFTRYRFQGSHTKRYKGGTAQSIWKFRAGDDEAVPLTADHAGTDHRPMWWNGRVWFRSDRDGTMNLWSMSGSGDDLKQHTGHIGLDVKDPSLGSGRIVYQLGADLWLYDIAAGETRRLDIDLPSDFDQMRERWITEPMDWLTASQISDDGEHLVLTARGQLFVTPVKGGRLVEVTRRNGARYRQGRMLPDGKTVLVLSDESGEVEWWSFRADGLGEGQQLTTDATTLRNDGVVSPDGKTVATWNHDQELWLYSLEDGAGRKIDFSPQWGFVTPRWSPDSRWLAYGMGAGNGLNRLWLYDTENNKKIALTTDRYDSYNAVFSPDGKAVYLLSDRHLSSTVGAPWGSRQPEPFFDKQTAIYRIPLEAGDRSPFQVDDELYEPVKDKENGEDEKDRKDKKKKKDGGVKVAVDQEGLLTRIQPVPVPNGNYGSLAVNAERLFWMQYEAGSDTGDLMALKIGNDDPKPVTIAAGLRGYQLSADGKKLLLRKGNAFHVVDAAAGKDADLSESAVDLSRWRFPVKPREEWLQMFVESWRLERDHFYDPDMHGVDWVAMLHKYLPMIDRVRSRGDLTDLQGQLAGELSALHTFVRSRDTRQGDDDIRPASLGAELVRDEAAGGYRVGHIYRTDPDIPEEMSPLLQPGVNVKEGDLITRVNGVDVLAVSDIATLLRDQAGRQVRLSLKDRETVVNAVTGDRDAEMRYDEWEYTRRQTVEEKGKGNLGYVHLRAMGGDNITEWYREFYPVIDRQGLIVDARHNRGGNIDSWILSRLMRQVWVYWQPRVGGGTGWRNMQSTFNGHVVLLVDAHTASDGELFAEGFKRLGIGKTIGVRTWGGEVWLNASNTLVDNGIMTASEFGVYGPEGEWLIEGHGFEPDIVVDNLPHATFEGEDAQLEAAIEHLKKLIEEDPRPTPKAPPYPDKSFRPGSPQ